MIIRPIVTHLPRTEHLNINWPVIACDQYSAQPTYWQALRTAIGEAPSTLKLVVPEADLLRYSPAELAAAEDECAREARRYIDDDTLRALPCGYILVKRLTRNIERWGLVAGVDLEAYDYRPGNDRPIRSTEETIHERIAPRSAIRAQSPIEAPHILLLADDPDDRIFAPARAAANAGELELIYDLPLYTESAAGELVAGRTAGLSDGETSVTGWLIPAEHALAAEIERALQLLPRWQSNGFMLAVGDGNHSLAAAQAHWFRLRDTLGERAPQTARYAAVEITNLHDPGLRFLPIHRLVKDIPPFSTYRKFNAGALELARQWGWKLEIGPPVPLREPGDLPPLTLDDASVRLLQILPGAYVLWTLRNTGVALHVEIVDRFIAELSKPEQVDYIHGDEALVSLVNSAEEPAVCGFALPPFSRKNFFADLAIHGVFPRKSFSLGEAEEKRYYLETRRIDI